VDAQARVVCHGSILPPPCSRQTILQVSGGTNGRCAHSFFGVTARSRRGPPPGRTSLLEREATVAALRRLVEPLLDAEGMSLVDIQWNRRGRRWVLTLFIDKEGGVSLDDCAQISRQVGERIDVENLIDHAYTLEVSSPGLDRPLRTLADYARFAEHLVRIITTMPIQGRSTIVGRLKGVEGQTVLVHDERAGIIPVPVTQIKHARLEIEF
jgi:ribosome maturation factor RimP